MMGEEVEMNPIAAETSREGNEALLDFFQPRFVSVSRVIQRESSLQSLVLRLQAGLTAYSFPR